MTARKAKAKTKAEPTEYVVLERIAALQWTQRPGEPGEPREDACEAWIEVGVQSALGKDAAIKAAVGDREGTFKAVPASSWKGGRIHAQTTLMDSKPLD